MKVVLHLGDVLTVELAGTDGTFILEYGKEEVSVHADMPDTDGRNGRIYSERFGDAHRAMKRELRRKGLAEAKN